MGPQAVPSAQDASRRDRSADGRGIDAIGDALTAGAAATRSAAHACAFRARAFSSSCRFASVASRVSHVPSPDRSSALSGALLFLLTSPSHHGEGLACRHRRTAARALLPAELAFCETGTRSLLVALDYLELGTTLTPTRPGRSRRLELEYGLINRTRCDPVGTNVARACGAKRGEGVRAFTDGRGVRRS